MRKFLHSFAACTTARPLKLLLALLLSFTIVKAQSGPATVTTDQTDYAPGATVYITGSGFLPGETVTLQVLHLGGTFDNSTSPAHQPWTVVADSLGNITATWLVPLDQDELGATLQLTATGMTSGRVAQATFTDSQQTFDIASNNSFSGAATYCKNNTASNLSAVFNTCSSGNGAKTGTNVTVTWYYNTSNSTTIAGATQVSQTTGANTGTNSTVTFTYLPLTTTAGSYYYFAVLSSPSDHSCGFTSTLTTSTTQLVTVNALPTATISYAGSPYCATGTATVTQTGQAGGTYSSTAGLTINSSTGAITLSSSTPGTYTVTYSFSNGTCPNTTTTSVTINALPTITGNTSVCAGSTTQLTGSGTPAASNPWVSSNTGVATVSSTGLVTGVSAGTSTITYTNNNGCSQTTTVTVNALPTATISYAGSPFCATGTATVTRTGQAGGTYSSTAGLTINSSTGAITLSSSTPGTYTVTYSFSNGTCPNTTTTSVTINALPTITGTTSVCVGSTTQLTGSGTPAASNPWVSSNTGVATVSSTGLVTGVSAGTSTITYTNSNGCSQTITVTVNPTNTISLTSAAGTNSQAVCVNTAITNITYSTTSATGATFSGLPTGVTGSWASNVVTISGTPSVAGTFNYTVTLTGGCGNITANGTITVTANNTISLTSAAGTNAQTVCNNTAITNITYSTTGATGATFSGLPTGVTGNWSSNVVTISGTPSVSGTFSYTVTLIGVAVISRPMVQLL